MERLPSITVHQPWAYLLADGRKPVENRSWLPPTNLVGKVWGIHAGKKDPRHFTGGSYETELARVFGLAGIEGSLADPNSYAFQVATHIGLNLGCMVGTGRLVGVVSDCFPIPEPFRLADATIGDLALGSLFFSGPYGWVFSETIRFRTPVPCQGKQGVWYPGEDVVGQCVHEYKKAKRGEAK